MRFEGPIEDRLEIRELCESYGDAVCRHDLKEWRSLWIDEAEWSHPDVGRLNGLDAIAAAVGAAMASMQNGDPLPRAKPEEVGLSSERLNEIAKRLNADIAAGRIPGAVVMIAERGERILIRPETSEAAVTKAAAALVKHLSQRTSRDFVVETIDGHPASGSRYLDAFREAGFKRGTRGLRYYKRV